MRNNLKTCNYFEKKKYYGRHTGSIEELVSFV